MKSKYAPPTVFTCFMASKIESVMYFSSVPDIGMLMGTKVSLFWAMKNARRDSFPAAEFRSASSCRLHASACAGLSN